MQWMDGECVSEICCSGEKACKITIKLNRWVICEITEVTGLGQMKPRTVCTLLCSFASVNLSEEEFKTKVHYNVLPIS